MKWRFKRHFTFLPIILIATGCSHKESIEEYSSKHLSGEFACHDKQSSKLEDHILRANHDGLLIRPDVTVDTNFLERLRERPLDRSQARAAMQHILCNAEKLAIKKGDSKVKLLVYIHGGLNRMDETDNRIHRGIPGLIMKEESDWHYPVFISWPSAAIPTFFEHTFRIREGRKANWELGTSTSPFIFLADLLRTIGNYPATMSYQLLNEKDRTASGSRRLSKYIDLSWKDSIRKFCPSAYSDPSECNAKPVNTSPRVAIDANLSWYNSESSDKFVRGTKQFATLIPRYTLGSLWHSGISGSAWDNMKRRAQNLFYPPQVFNSGAQRGTNLGAFFELLLSRSEHMANDRGLEYEITLVGHSMGAIAINHALIKYQNSWLKTDYLRNIVFMAGAANINDSLAALTPQMHKTNPPNFYNLTLNRVAEVSEMHAAGAVPLGSLLISIDKHHEGPEHPLKRTIGSEVNVLSSLEEIDKSFRRDDRKNQIVFKAFDRKVGHLPSMHSHFGDMPFWRRSTWSIATDNPTSFPDNWQDLEASNQVH